jgi:hypothetical protein
MVRQNMRHTIIHPRSVNGSRAPQYSTEAHIPHLHARDTQMGNTPVPCTRALDKLRCKSRSAPFRGPCLCQISKHRLLETLFSSRTFRLTVGRAGGPQSLANGAQGAEFPARRKSCASYLPRPSCNSMTTEKSYASSLTRSPKAAHTQTCEHIACARKQTQKELTKGVFGVSFCASEKPRCALPSPGLFPAPLPRPRLPTDYCKALCSPLNSCARDRNSSHGTRT